MEIVLSNVKDHAICRVASITQGVTELDRQI